MQLGRRRELGGHTWRTHPGRAGQVGLVQTAGPAGVSGERDGAGVPPVLQGRGRGLMLVTLYTVSTKLLQGRLEHDWAHRVLHLGSALVAAYAGWSARSSAPACAFTWAIGVGYFALGCYGWFTRGLLLGTPLAIALGVPENLFHLLLSVPALVVVLLDLRSAPSRVPERG